MRNRFPGTCYRCRKTVAVGDGHFEKFQSGWRTQHATCAIEFRGTSDPEREAYRQQMMAIRANQTGRRGQRARKALREQTLAGFDDA